VGKSVRKRAGVHEVASVSLGELIHRHVRIAIETAVHEELRAALGARSYNAATSGGATATARRRAR